MGTQRAESRMSRRLLKHYTESQWNIFWKFSDNLSNNFVKMKIWIFWDHLWPITGPWLVSTLWPRLLGSMDTRRRRRQQLFCETRIFSNPIKAYVAIGTPGQGELGQAPRARGSELPVRSNLFCYQLDSAGEEILLLMFSDTSTQSWYFLLMVKVATRLHGLRILRFDSMKKPTVPSIILLTSDN